MCISMHFFVYKTDFAVCNNTSLLLFSFIWLLLHALNIQCFFSRVDDFQILEQALVAEKFSLWLWYIPVFKLFTDGHCLNFKGHVYWYFTIMHAFVCFEAHLFFPLQNVTRSH